MRRIIATVLIAFAPASAAATVLSDWKLDDLAARADLVVVGTAGDKRSFHAGEKLMTETEIIVETTLAGKPVSRFWLSQLGGRDGNTIVEIVGDAILRPGERTLLFTYGHEDGRRYLVGMALGAWTATPENAARFVQQIDVPVIAEDGAIGAPPGTRTITLEDVRRALEARRP